MIKSHIHAHTYTDITCVYIASKILMQLPIEMYDFEKYSWQTTK